MLHFDTKKLGRFERLCHRFGDKALLPQINKDKQGYAYLHRSDR